MAVDDDLRSLATEDVVYLTKEIGIGTGQLEVFKGRLRQTGQGEWVFTTFTGQSGVVGLMLGPVGGWASSNIPGQGIQVQIPFAVVPGINLTPPGWTGDPIYLPEYRSLMTLTTVIPSDFAE